MYAWFSEGFSSAVVKEATALLTGLA